MMEHLTVSEVAALWGCGDEAVRAMIRRGRMPREHFVKRCHLRTENEDERRRKYRVSGNIFCLQKW